MPQAAIRAAASTKLSLEISVCHAGTNSIAKMLITIVLTAIAMAISTLFLLLVYRRTSRPQGKKHFAVVVLGDVGRSPRMQYHTVSLSEMGDEHNTSVTLIGYSGEECIESLRKKENVSVYSLSDYNHLIELATENRFILKSEEQILKNWRLAPQKWKL